MAGGLGASSFTVAPESTAAFVVKPPSSTTLAAGVSGRPLWPSDISGLVLWLPGDSIQGITSGASLSAWTDSSASASHATQASAASQPIYVANAQNGLGAVAFGTAISTFMQSPTSVSDNVTLGLVSSPTSIGAARPFGSNSGTARLSVSGGNWVYARGGTLSDGSATVGAWKSIIGFGDVSAQSICTLTVNSSVFTASVTTSSVTGLLATIGSNSPSGSTYTGMIGEAVLYNRQLVNIERSSLDSYFRTKWGI